MIETATSKSSNGDNGDPIWPFVTPLFLHLLIDMLLIPNVVDSYSGDGFDKSTIPSMTSETWWYMAALGIQTLLAVAVLLKFRKTVFSAFPFKLSWLSVFVGAIGIVLWLACCWPQWEGHFFDWMGTTFENLTGMDLFSVDRPSFDPNLIADSGIRYGFLGIRFTVLCLVVPVVEELFVRGFLVRWYQDPEFEKIPLLGMPWKFLLAASLYGVLTHPGEAIAAFLWFGLVSGLQRTTGNFWDCVVAHAVTNFLLGVYVLQTAEWHLW